MKELKANVLSGASTLNKFDKNRQFSVDHLWAKHVTCNTKMSHALVVIKQPIGALSTAVAARTGVDHDLHGNHEVGYIDCQLIRVSIN